MAAFIIFPLKLWMVKIMLLFSILFYYIKFLLGAVLWSWLVIYCMGFCDSSDKEIPFLNGMQAVQTVRFIFLCVLLFLVVSEHLLETWSVKLLVGRQSSRLIWTWVWMSLQVNTGRIWRLCWRRGVWQLSPTECLGAGIALRLSLPRLTPRAISEALQGRDLSGGPWLGIAPGHS